MLCLTKEEREKGTAVALGYFDGIHIGHRAVLQKALSYAKEKDLVPTVMLFDIHPRKLVSGSLPPMLMSENQKREALKEMGFRVVDFNFRESVNLSPEEFAEKILLEKLNVKFVSCGYDYRYGKGGKGNAETLKESLGKKGVEVFTVPAVELNGEVVSSTKIRQLIAEGEAEKANSMLGKEFSYHILVEKGDGIGHTIGTPTINQYFPEDFIVPKYGVYASRVKIEGEFYPSVTNVGIRPTVGGTSLRSETCIFDFSGNLYGKEVEVYLVKYLREEKKFSSVDELKKAIESDIHKCKEVLKMKKENLKAIFFDFDDTLQSRKGAYRLYCESFLTKYFPDIDEEERLRKLDEMEEYVDGGYKDREVYFPEIIDLWKWDNHPPMQELYDSFNYDFGKYIVLLDGAIDVLNKIKEKGYILGCITNGVSSLQNIKLDTAGIRDMFDVVVVSGDIGIYKPDRRIFDEAIRRAGVKNEEAMFVGDHPVNDIEGALSADMQVIRMNYGDFKGKGLGKAGVTAEIESITELLKYI